MRPRVHDIGNHFLFNSLGKLEAMIINNQVIEASNFLGEFAVLLRYVFRFQQTSRIDLEEEIALSRLYLAIERTRYNLNFQYEFEQTFGLQKEVVKIPPFLVQRFLESCLNLLLSSGLDWSSLQVFLTHSTVGQLIIETQWRLLDLTPDIAELIDQRLNSGIHFKTLQRDSEIQYKNGILKITIEKPIKIVDLL